MTEPADHPSTSDTPETGKTPESAKAEPGKIDASKAEPAKAETSKASSDDKAGTALAPTGSGPVNPFLRAAAEHAPTPDAVPPAPRSFTSRMLDYSAHAAIIVGLIGFAWSVGDHVFNRSAAPATPDALPLADATATGSVPKSADIKSADTKSADTKSAAEAKPAPKRDELAELRQSNQKMHDEIRALRSSIETLRNVVRRDTTPEQVRMLSAGLDGVKTSLGTMRTETSSSIAQLNTKVDKLQPGRLRDLTERVGRLEHQAADPTATGSIPRAAPERDMAKAAPKPPVKPASLASASEARSSEAHASTTHPSTTDDKPQAIAGWVVRDVYQGVALVENKRGGTMEVEPGTTIPGAGVVKSIDRHGNGWTVTTSKGQFASAAATPRPAQQRTPYGRGYGYGYGYGYGPGGYRYGY